MTTTTRDSAVPPIGENLSRDCDIYEQHMQLLHNICCDHPHIADLPRLILKHIRDTFQAVAVRYPKECSAGDSGVHSFCATMASAATSSSEDVPVCRIRDFSLAERLAIAIAVAKAYGELVSE